MKVRRIYKIHKWTGLLAGIFILFMGITGSILVFHSEIKSAERKKYEIYPRNERINLDLAIHTVIKAYPNYDIRLVDFQERPEMPLFFSVRNPTTHYAVVCHPNNGKIIACENNSSSLVIKVLDLHYSLYGGYVGQAIVFFIGLLFFTSLVTGLVIYRKHVLKVLLFRIPIRNDARIRLSSIHYYFGVWGLLLNMLLVLTGLLISFDNLSGHEKKAPVTPIITTSVDHAISLIKNHYHYFHPTYIWFPTDAEGKIKICGRVDGEPFYWTQYFNFIALDAKTGQMTPLKLTSQEKLSKKIASIVGVIHLAEFDNSLLKIIFSFTGLSGPLLAITGFFIRRRKSRGKNNTKISQ